MLEKPDIPEKEYIVYVKAGYVLSCNIETAITPQGAALKAAAGLEFGVLAQYPTFNVIAVDKMTPVNITFDGKGLRVVNAPQVDN